MKFLSQLFVLMIIFTFAFGCEKEIITPEQTHSPTIAFSGVEDLIRPDVQCGTSRFSDLKTDTGTPFGTVEILNDADNLYMLIDMEQGKFLNATQVFFGTSSAIPTDGNGNMLMEDFQVQTIVARGASRYTIIVPKSSMPNCPDIVMWAQASEKNMFGQTTNTSEVWMTGIPIYDGSFYKYCMGACVSNIGPIGRLAN